MDPNGMDPSATDPSEAENRTESSPGQNRLRGGMRSATVLCVIGCLGGCVSAPGNTVARAEVSIDSVRNELLARAALDQKYRSMAFETMADTTQMRVLHEMSDVDASNTAWLEQIVAQFGWPDSKRFGAEAAHAAWLLVQHADQRPEFQARMLPLLDSAVQRGEAKASDLAYLVDRVRVKQNQPQRYGTQYMTAKNEHGEVMFDANHKPQYLLPIVENIDSLDVWRQRAGLGPWREYEERMARSQNRAAARVPRS